MLQTNEQQQQQQLLRPSSLLHCLPPAYCIKHVFAEAPQPGQRTARATAAGGAGGGAVQLRDLLYVNCCSLNCLGKCLKRQKGSKGCAREGRGGGCVRTGNAAQCTRFASGYEPKRAERLNVVPCSVFFCIPIRIPIHVNASVGKRAAYPAPPLPQLEPPPKRCRLWLQN